MILKYIPLAFFSLLLAGGCKPVQQTPRLLPLELEKSNPNRLLSFYFGGLTEEDFQNPFESGILSQQGDAIYINLDRLDSLVTGGALSDTNENGVLEWDELEPFIEKTYYTNRGFPSTLLELKNLIEFTPAGANWLNVEVRGMMTTALRSIYIQKDAVLEALKAYRDNQQTVLYPVGTTILAEHIIDEDIVETTVMQKRPDGYWDFFVYNDQGFLAPSTTTDPKPLAAPTRCVGCHFGNKAFEPEFSFPNPAPVGPFGERGVYVADHLRNEEVTQLLNEHEKRSDTVLGLYGTIVLADLIHRQNQGALLTEDEQAILDQFD